MLGVRHAGVHRMGVRGFCCAGIWCAGVRCAGVRAGVHRAGIRLSCWPSFAVHPLCRRSSDVLVFVVRAFTMLAFRVAGICYAGIRLSFAVHPLCWRSSRGHSPCWRSSVGLAFTCRAGIRLLRRLPSCVRPPVVLVFIHCAAERRASVCVHADVGVVITRVDSY
jgi:hypothetical protein